MEVAQLKQKIESNTLDAGFLVLQYSDNTFLAHQYIEAIARNRNLSITYLASLEDFALGSFLPGLYVCFLDTYRVDSSAPPLENLIVVCQKVEGTSERVVSLPALEEWQIQEYVSGQLPGVPEDLVKQLCIAAQYDIYLLESEIQKVRIFPKGQQLNILSLENLEYLGSSNTYGLIKAVMRKAPNVSEEYAASLTKDSLGLVTLLLRNFKQVIDIQLGLKATPEALGVSYKQFKAIQGNCGFYSNEQLIAIYQFLLKIDYLIKGGIIKVEELKDYLIPQILTLGGWRE